MTHVVVLSKLPAGGRCSLYMHYAETLHDRFGFAVEIRYCEGYQVSQAPAMLIDNRVVEPEDGAIVSPEDLTNALGGCCDEQLLAEAVAVLTAAQEDWMRQWAGG